jgi:hypothetical protein
MNVHDGQQSLRTVTSRERTGFGPIELKIPSRFVPEETPASALRRRIANPDSI